MLNIGCHLSASKGYFNMGKEALSINANTFQFFSRNPRGSKAKELDLDDIEKFKKLAKENNFATILAHAPYILNPCSSNEQNRILAFELMQDDLKRLEYIPNQMYNFHPGSHTGQGVETGINQIADMLNRLLTKEQTTTVLLETMAGKGSEVGSKFEELRAIIDKVELKNKMGVCLDTCHVHDAGYDIVNDLDGVLDEFDRVIGLKYLKAIHLNDSKNPFESHKDRHEVIGGGSLGIDAFERIINHPKLRHLPFYLETPNELEGYKKEIELLRGKFKE
ncbi:MAG: deoxyribonuclease IV [Oscillospiraceae bacterium]|nr:deoxyribonuclease IV [Oscillospiraceae bacterium]